jgi:hypothetical protein
MFYRSIEHLLLFAVPGQANGDWLKIKVNLNKSKVHAYADALDVN